MCLVKQYCLASKSYSALASFCWTGILKIISKLFRYLFPSPPPLYYPRSSGRGTIKFLITNQILALLRSEAIFPVKQEWTVPSRSAKLLPVLSIRISSGDRMFRQWFMPRHCLTPYMPAPTARSCCWDKEQGERRKVSSCKSWEVRAIPNVKLNKKQQWKIFLMWVEVWGLLLSHKSDDGQRGPLLHARRQCCSSC